VFLQRCMYLAIVLMMKNNKHTHMVCLSNLVLLINRAVRRHSLFTCIFLGCDLEIDR
jgi:hypothetical protein